MENKEFLSYIAASYPIIWVDTHEYERSIKTLCQTLKKVGHNCYKWDILTGITDLENNEIIEKSNDDPVQPIQFLEGENKITSVVFVQDYHVYFNADTSWRRLLNNLENLKSSSNAFVIVSPIVDIPQEIERYVTVMDFNLPMKEELEEKLSELCDDLGIDMPEDKELKEIITAGTGLTEFEFENAVCLSISKTGKIKSNTIHKQKEQLIRKNSTLQITKFDKGFESLYGLDNLKYFSKRMVNSSNGRGILLVGVPGGGKSHFAKTLGNETGRITINMDFGSMMGSLVGETEKLTREALKTIDAMEPAILFVDEIEKGLAGVSGYNGDSGTSQRQGGQFLKWLSDHESDVYVVATSNDISKLPPEYLRAERWDAIFFVDLPTEEERTGILDIYRNEFSIDENDEVPNIENWTGAEIKTLCKLSNSLEIPLMESEKYVTPLYKTMEEKINRLREWSNGRTIPASNIIEDELNKKPDKKRKVHKVADLG
ncbi:MAG: AAA family ATPase [archaeon]